MSQRVPFKSEPISLDDLVDIIFEYVYFSCERPGVSVSAYTPLSVYNLDSLDTISIQTTIEEKIGRELPDDTVDPDITCRQLHERICKA